MYADVSADYLLGFIDTKRKEPSAEMVKDDFGLSDEAMKILAWIKNEQQPDCKGELSSDLVNMFLEDKDFWESLGARLSVYISCLTESRSSDIDVDVALFGLDKLFEEMVNKAVNRFCDEKYNDLPNQKLNFSGPFTN